MLLCTRHNCCSLVFVGLPGLLLAFATLAGEVARAADGPSLARSRVLLQPFPRSERAQSVWQSGACWSECGAQCAWGQNACLQVNEQGQCLAYTDSCDRYCQRECRTSGGPLIDFTN
jgi:hypothetical protein